MEEAYRDLFHHNNEPKLSSEHTAHEDVEETKDLVLEGLLKEREQTDDATRLKEIGIEINKHLLGK